MVINRMMLGTRLSNLSQGNITISQANSENNERIIKKALKGFTVERNFCPANAKYYYSEALQPNEERCIAEQIREAQNHLKQLRAERERLADQLQSAREQAEAQAEAFRKWRIALEIAARIMRGDNVPQSDKDFLLQQSPGLYKLAMSTRITKEDPEDLEAIAPDENASCSGADSANIVSESTLSSSSSSTSSSSSSTSSSSTSSSSSGSSGAAI